MAFKISKPSKQLAPFIKHFWMIESIKTSQKPYIQRIIPNGLMELSFYFEDKPKIYGTRINESDSVVVSGQVDSHYDIEIEKKLSLFSITFQPMGARYFFDIPMSELLNSIISLHSVNKLLADELETELFEARSFENRVRKAEVYLNQFLYNRYQNLKDQRIDWSIQYINKSLGLVNVDYLSSRAFLSKKQFERTFNTSIGITPKKFLKIVRFQNAIYIRQNNKHISLTNLAIESGYFDQSHMINDFKSLSGLTPKQFFDNCEPYSDYFA